MPLVLKLFRQLSFENSVDPTSIKKLGKKRATNKMLAQLFEQLLVQEKKEDGLTIGLCVKSYTYEKEIFNIIKINFPDQILKRKKEEEGILILIELQKNYTFKVHR